MNSGKPADTDEYVPVTQIPQGLPEPISTLVETEFGAATHAGRVRSHNEDCYLIARAERVLDVVSTNLPSEHIPSRFGELVYGMIVADGLGGSVAGEIASRLAVTTFTNLVLHTPDWIMRTSGDPEAARILDRIAERYRLVGAAIAERAEGDAALAGMATTMTLAVSSGPDLFLGHVGDSRAYLLRGEKLMRLTRDHTYAQHLADSGLIPQEDVAVNRFRHVLTRALGPSGDKVEVDVARLRLHDGDQLLLCTDGLTGMVSEDLIRDQLLSGRPAAEVCDALVAAALAHGGKDNVTVVLGRYRIPDAS